MESHTFARNVKFLSQICLVTVCAIISHAHTYISSFFKRKSSKNSLRFEILCAKEKRVLAIRWHHHCKQLCAASSCMVISRWPSGMHL